MALTQLKTGAIADDAVTTDKLANAINTERTANTAKVSLTDNSVTLAKMAGGTDGQIITYDASGDPVAVGPGTDGQVLTSTGAGSPPAFEDASGTTINNNADNRLITGSGTANTLNGEANLTFSSSLLVSDGNGSVNVGGNYALLKRTSGTTNYIAAPNADAVLDISADETISFGTVNTGDFNSTERMRIDADGRVGVGIVPQASQYSGWTVLQVGESGALASNKTTGDTNTTQLSCNSYLNSTASAYKYLHNDVASRYTQAQGRHTFYVAASGSADADISFTEEVRIDSDGLKFNGDTAAANALDDYEEGTWTPTDGSGASISLTNNSTAQYTKIGRLVYIQFDVTYASNSNSSNSSLGSLPFSLAEAYGSGVVGWTGKDSANGIVCHVDTGSKCAFMDNSSSNSSGDKHLRNDELSGVRIIGMAMYLAAT